MAARPCFHTLRASQTTRPGKAKLGSVTATDTAQPKPSESRGKEGLASSLKGDFAMPQENDAFPPRGYRFEWDETKNRSNIRKHGFDFADAERLFSGILLVRADLRRDYEKVVG